MAVLGNSAAAELFPVDVEAMTPLLALVGEGQPPCPC